MAIRGHQQLTGQRLSCKSSLEAILHHPKFPIQFPVQRDAAENIPTCHLDQTSSFHLGKRQKPYQKMTLHEFRKTYRMGSLEREQMKSEPVDQFREWFETMCSLESLPDWWEVNAMTLSTTTPQGSVTSRIVLLKGFSDQGFLFFTNYQSRKGKQLAACNQAALNFYWPMMERQVRIEGSVEKALPSISDQYFYSRPIESQCGAIASPQSSVIQEDHCLEDAVSAMLSQADDHPPVRPDHWGGFLLRPDLFEFWQGKPSRLHDRYQYRKQESGWLLERLAP
jgi:pyridoxamine 5'-phosphate oxidase